MAWNPSPKVALARDFAKKLQRRKERIHQLITAERIQLSTLKQILKVVNLSITEFYNIYPEIKKFIMGYKK